MALVKKTKNKILKIDRNPTMARVCVTCRLEILEYKIFVTKR